MDALKKIAGQRAAQLVQSGSLVGLGTGSTAKHFVDALAARVANESGFTVKGAVATSLATADQARSLGLPLLEPNQVDSLDIAVDGADEIATDTLHLVKGAGGALLREKMVEVKAKRLVIIADESKLNDSGKLGVRFPIPVEVVKFDWEATKSRLQALTISSSDPQCTAVGRTVKDGDDLLVTDGGNYIIDCRFEGGFAAIDTAAEVIKGTVGVIEHGLFVAMADHAIVAMKDGSIVTLEKKDDGSVERSVTKPDCAKM